jgi:hypothetical protein
MDNTLERFNLKEILKLIAEDPNKAADHLDRMCEKLKEISQKLRNSKKKIVNPFKHVGGVSEVVRLNVIGPDGKIKRSSILGG